MGSRNARLMWAAPLVAALAVTLGRALGVMPGVALITVVAVAVAEKGAVGLAVPVAVAVSWAGAAGSHRLPAARVKPARVTA